MLDGTDVNPIEGNRIFNIKLLETAINDFLEDHKNLQNFCTNPSVHWLPSTEKNTGLGFKASMACQNCYFTQGPTKFYEEV